MTDPKRGRAHPAFLCLLALALAALLLLGPRRRWRPDPDPAVGLPAIASRLAPLGLAASRPEPGGETLYLTEGVRRDLATLTVNSPPARWRGVLRVKRSTQSAYDHGLPCWLFAGYDLVGDVRLVEAARVELSR